MSCGLAVGEADHEPRRAGHAAAVPRQRGNGGSGRAGRCHGPILALGTGQTPRHLQSTVAAAPLRAAVAPSARNRAQAATRILRLAPSAAVAARDWGRRAREATCSARVEVRAVTVMDGVLRAVSGEQTGRMKPRRAERAILPTAGPGGASPSGMPAPGRRV